MEVFSFYFGRGNLASTQGYQIHRLNYTEAPMFIVRSAIESICCDFVLACVLLVFIFTFCNGYDVFIVDQFSIENTDTDMEVYAIYILHTISLKVHERFLLLSFLLFCCKNGAGA